MYFLLLPYLNLGIALGSLVLAGVTLIFIYNYFYPIGKITSLIQKILWPAIILTALAGTVISLIYSEYFLFIPCSLCWLQRIALYPQVLLAILAYKRCDNQHFPIYGIGLSIFGLLVSVYHYIYQLIPKDARDGLVPCLADGSADCGEKVINLFGFVTFPLISVITFVFLITLYLYLKRK